MGFIGICESDPLLEFIRNTYDAIPLKLPDRRFKPLTLFTIVEKRVRYLGELEDLISVHNWTPPRIDETDVPDISKRSSRMLSVGAALDLLGPFLANLLALTQVDVEASFKSAKKRSDGVRLVLAKAKRSLVRPIACVSIFEKAKIQLPSGLGELGSEKKNPLYLIDSILTAREITLMLEGNNATDEAVKIETGLVGKVSADNVFRRQSELSIRSSTRATFAFTCIKLAVGSSGLITGLDVTSKMPRLGATGVSSVSTIVHESLGAAHELIEFDE